MFKAGIIAFAICVAAVGTTFWLKTGFDAKSADHVSPGMPSILEMARQSALERTSCSRSPGTILICNRYGLAQKKARDKCRGQSFTRAELHTMLTT